MKTKPLIPLLDYLRIHAVIRSVLDSVDAHTAHACMFFSIAGAAILREFYKKDAVQLAGAALFLVNEQQRNVISFATLTEGQVQSSDTSFHAWIQCDENVIDFMAPMFPEACTSAGHPFIAPRRMFQKKWADMAPSHEHLDQEGDFPPSAKSRTDRQPPAIVSEEACRGRSRQRLPALVPETTEIDSSRVADAKRLGGSDSDQIEQQRGFRRLVNSLRGSHQSL